MPNSYSTQLILPEYSLPNSKIGENLAERFAHHSLTVQADIFATEHNNIVLVKTDRPLPFCQFYIVKQGEVDLERCADLPILKVKKASQLSLLNENTELAWVRHPLASLCEHTPEQINENWIGKFRFKAEDTAHNIDGLRTPQIGALHAISAEFSRSTNIEPCTVVLPTGTGKTETMLSTTIYHRCQKVLVLVPSNSLRDQVGDKFKTLGCLPELGVVADDIVFPAVAKIKRGIKSVAEANELLAKSNVLIATPQILNSKFSSPAVLTEICESCSHLFVDEAHHISAQKWAEIRDKFKGKRVVQFTATPFRNDTQSLGAR